MSQFTKLVLPYSFAALEPYIDQQTMEIHYGKHHQGYTDKLNAALEAHPDLQEKSIEDLLQGLQDLPEVIRVAVKNNGGGFYNHNLFFANLMVNKGAKPEGKLLEAIVQGWGTFESFKEVFSNAANTRFGSGWAWLMVKDDKSLAVASTPNQDNPLMPMSEVQGTPILTLDVWEHAYYLHYQNRRAEYVENFWNIVNWERVGELYLNLR